MRAIIPSRMALVKVYTAHDSTTAHFVRTLLEREGIAATVLGDRLALALGGIPFVNGTMPAVWVSDMQRPAAEKIVRQFREGGIRFAFAGQSSWTCPKCGETIEPQFTDCWNCGAARPGETTDADESPASAELDSTLALDLPCSRCNYNLRGLRPNNRCPECGLPISRSLLLYVNAASPEQRDDVERLVGAIVLDGARRIGCPPAAVLPVLEAWFLSLQEIEPPQVGLNDRAADAIALSHAVVRSLFHEFSADELKAALESWKLTTYRDLGRALFAFIDQGLIEPTDRVTPEDFPDAPIQVVTA